MAIPPQRPAVSPRPLAGLILSVRDRETGEPIATGAVEARATDREWRVQFDDAVLIGDDSVRHVMCSPLHAEGRMADVLDGRILTVRMRAAESDLVGASVRDVHVAIDGERTLAQLDREGRAPGYELDWGPLEVCRASLNGGVLIKVAFGTPEQLSQVSDVEVGATDAYELAAVLTLLTTMEHVDSGDEIGFGTSPNR